jgi:hypothetical protein
MSNDGLNEILASGVDFRCPETHEVFQAKPFFFNGRQYTQWSAHRTNDIPDVAPVSMQELTRTERARILKGVATPDRYTFNPNTGFDFHTSPTLNFLPHASEKFGSNIWVLQHDENPTSTHKDEVYSSFFALNDPQKHDMVALVDTTGDSNAVKAVEVYLNAKGINTPLITLKNSKHPSFNWRTSTSDPNSLLVGEFGVDLKHYYDKESISQLLRAFFAPNTQRQATSHLNLRDRELIRQTHSPVNIFDYNTYHERDSFIAEATLRGQNLTGSLLDCTNPSSDNGPLRDYNEIIDRAITEGSHPRDSRPISVADCDYFIMSTGSGKRIDELRNTASESTKVIGMAMKGRHAIAEHYTGAPCANTECLPAHLSNPFKTDLLQDVIATDAKHGHLVVDPNAFTYLARGYRDKHLQNLVPKGFCDAGCLPLGVLAGQDLKLDNFYQQEGQVGSHTIPKGSTVVIELTNGTPLSAEQIIKQYRAA